MFTFSELPLVEWEFVPPVGPRPPKGFVGLKNAGATCYMNSVLQQVSIQIKRTKFYLKILLFWGLSNLLIWHGRVSVLCTFTISKNIGFIEL